MQTLMTRCLGTMW